MFAWCELSRDGLNGAGPEKAGVGGSIPSLATISKNNNLDGQLFRKCKRFAREWRHSIGMQVLKTRFPSPQDPDCHCLYPPHRRLLKEGRAAVATLQVPPGRQEQDCRLEDPLMGKGRTTGAGDSGRVGTRLNRPNFEQ